MPIEKGTLTTCEKYKQYPEECLVPKNITGKTLTAYVELSQISGVTSIGGKDHRILDVNLNMEKGAFSINNIEMNDEEKIDLSRSIKAYFVSNKVDYLINRLDITNIPVIDDMKPNGFRFKVLKTPAGVNILQLFIQTGDRTLLNSTQTFMNNMPEPLPEGSETSLIISSRLLFSNILPQSLNKSNSTWRLEGEEYYKSDKRQNFRCKFINAKFLVTDPTFNVVVDHSLRQNMRRASIFTFPENKIEGNFSGITFTPKSDGQLELLLKDCKSLIKIQEYYRNKQAGFITDSYTRILDMELVSNIYGLLNFEIESKEDRNQNIVIKKNNSSFNIKGHLSGGGPSVSSGATIRNKVDHIFNNTVSEKIFYEIKNINFSPISTFAIKNLLFPKHEYLKLKKGLIPGDMLILGNFSSIKND